MRQSFIRTMLVAVAVLGVARMGIAQPSDELNALRQEIESLKSGQKTIQRDLDEIKNILRGRAGAAAAAPARDLMLSIDGAPIKGNKDAKVTLVDFTDYQ